MASVLMLRHPRIEHTLGNTDSRFWKISIFVFYLFFHRARPGSVVDAQAAGDHGGAAAIHAAGAAPAMRNAEPALRRVRRAAGADADPVASVLAAHPAGSGV